MSPASASNNQRDGASGSLGAQTTPTTQRERELAEAAAYERERRRVQDRRELSERPELVLMDPGGLLKQQ